MSTQPRLMRDADRIERILAPTEARIRLTLYTAALCRVIRKDYNIVCAKIYFARGPKTLLISKILRELERVAIEAELASERYRSADFANIQLTPSIFDVRVVSPFANRYQQSISRIDGVNHLLMLAETKGLVSRRERRDIINPAIALLHELKGIALELLKTCSDKTIRGSEDKI